MIPFFNKKQREELKLEGQQSVVSSEEVLNERDEEKEDARQIETGLSIHPSWQLPEEDVYSFQFLNRECEPLQPNQLALNGVDYRKNEKKQHEFTAFIRHSLDKTIQLGNATIVLLDADDQIIGRKSFDLSEAGEIPPESSRPWTFVFGPKDLFQKEIPKSGWKLVFQVQSKASKQHKIDFEENWKKNLPKQELDRLRDMVDQLGAPKKGEVNFLGLQATLHESTGDLHVVLLIRNGSEKSITLEQMPLHVQDASGEVIAKGGFKFNPKIKVKMNTSKPWNFVFPKEKVIKENPDLSDWKAYAPNNKA